MVEIFLEAPLELKIIIGGCLISGAWFMYDQYRTEKKRQRLRRVDVIRPRPKLTIVKK
jgi:hypothetical protein